MIGRWTEGVTGHQDNVPPRILSKGQCHTRRQPEMDPLIRTEETFLRSHLVVILGRGRRHVLKLGPHVHVLHRAVGRPRVRIDPHPLQLLYWYPIIS